MPRDKGGTGRTGSKQKAAKAKREAAAAAQAAEQPIQPAPQASPRPKRRKRRAWRSSRRRPLTPLPRPHLRYPRQAARRPPAGARSCSTTRRCRRECARRSAALPSRVRAAFCVGPPIGTIGAMGRTWGGLAMRNAALVAGQKRQPNAGWWGGAGWTVGDRHPRLWCAWDKSAFCSFCPIVRAE